LGNNQLLTSFSGFVVAFQIHLQETRMKSRTLLYLLVTLVSLSSLALAQHGTPAQHAPLSEIEENMSTAPNMH
jgi:hypothetical protein